MLVAVHTVCTLFVLIELVKTFVLGKNVRSRFSEVRHLSNVCGSWPFLWRIDRTQCRFLRSSLHIIIFQNPSIRNETLFFSCILILIKPRNGLISLTTNLHTLRLIMLISKNFLSFGFLLLFYHFYVILILSEIRGNKLSNWLVWIHVWIWIRVRIILLFVYKLWRRFHVMF